MVQACTAYGIPVKNIQKKLFLIQKMIGIGEPPLGIEILKKLNVIDFMYAFKRDKKVDMEGLSFLEKLKSKLRLKKR